MGSRAPLARSKLAPKPTAIAYRTVSENRAAGSSEAEPVLSLGEAVREGGSRSTPSTGDEDGVA